MGKFTDYIDGFADTSSTLAKNELKELIISAKKNESEFVGSQAVNVECWTNWGQRKQGTIKMIELYVVVP